MINGNKYSTFHNQTHLGLKHKVTNGLCVLALANSAEDVPATVAEEKVVHCSVEPGCCFSRSLFLSAPHSAILAKKSRSGFCFLVS